jgi:CDP-diacylglycerol--glycerol-3-phosphate 3-phosphatidyltransferase
MNPQIIYTFALLTIMVVLALAYAVRVIVHGRVHYDRVDRQQGSVLLAKSLMEMLYWGLQPLADFFILLKISSNGVSFLSLFLGAVAGVSLVSGNFGAAAFSSAFSAILDAVDGMVARKTGTASDAGEVLDASVDRYVEFFFFGGLILYYREEGELMILALAALLGSFMVSYSTAKAEALRVTPPRGSMRRPERALYLTFGAMFSPITEGYSMILALLLVGIFANGSALRRLYSIAQLVKKPST